jgi:hypothetical protein
MATPGTTANHVDEGENAYGFINEEERSVNISLRDFNRKKLEILKAQVGHKSKACTKPFRLHFEDGNFSDCDLLNDCLTNELAYLNCDGIKFDRCKLSLESIRALLHLIVTMPGELRSLEIYEVSGSENFDPKSMADEFIHLMATAGLSRFEYSRTTYSGGIQYQLDLRFLNRDSFDIWITHREFASLPLQTSEGLPLDQARVLMRILQDVKTLESLQLGNSKLSGETVILICRGVASLRKKVSISLGEWDVSNPDANNAVYELIRRGACLSELTLGCAETGHPGLSVDALSDALSSSISLGWLNLWLRDDGAQRAIDLLEDLTRRIKYPNRLGGIWAEFGNLIVHDPALRNRFERANAALNAKLRRMQSKRSFMLIAMAYAVTTMKNKTRAQCSFTMLNADVLRKLAVFLT